VNGSFTDVSRQIRWSVDTQPPEPSDNECFPARFTQWVADNIDHNVATLDGLGTFHGMGIIAVKARTGDFAPDVTDHSTERVAWHVSIKFLQTAIRT